MQVNFRSISIYYIISIHNSNKRMLPFSVEFTDFQKKIKTPKQPQWCYTWERWVRRQQWLCEFHPSHHSLGPRSHFTLPDTTCVRSYFIYLCSIVTNKGPLFTLPGDKWDGLYWAGVRFINTQWSQGYRILHHVASHHDDNPRPTVAPGYSKENLKENLSSLIFYFSNQGLHTILSISWSQNLKRGIKFSYTWKMYIQITKN